MKSSTLIWILVVLVILAGGWYWWHLTSNAAENDARPTTAMGTKDSPNQGNMGGMDAGTPQQPMADGQEDSVIGSNVALGIDKDAKGKAHLIGYNGMTLYTFDKDTSKMSTCTDTCASKWPPYIVSPTDSLEQLQAGLDDTIVGTTQRADGQLQVTYKGHPLYFYAGDKTGSDTAGDGIGGVWHIVKP